MTYNHALASDVRRLLALMNVPSSPEDGGIAVRTVMSFVTSWLARLGLLDETSDWLESVYETQCGDALDMIRCGALRSDIEAIKQEDPANFAFDYVVADEAQDWPLPELELLKALYGPERLCLADGVDQLVRGGASNWEVGVPETRRMTVPLKHCLRMKANLTVFANALAEQVGVNWRVEPNRLTGGGRIILVAGSIRRRRALVEELLQDARQAGNEAIDLLFCVPPTDVARDNEGQRFSQLAMTLQEWSYETWDGTGDRCRRDFPRGGSVLRVVQYASCRGLEGWTVVLEGFDTFWQSARDHAWRIEDAECNERHLEKSKAAWRQCLIPPSRAIDTLIISIEDPQSEASKELLKIPTPWR
ncbi:hypothetical protein ACVIWU_006707 [Bradyrhizobium sp. USDA 4509]